MNEFGTTFHDRLMTSLKFKNFKRGSFFGELNITRATIHSWKRGSMPSVNTVFLLSNKLDVDPQWLITGINNQDSSDSKSPAQISNRIIYQLEKINNHKISKEDSSFYLPLNNCIDPMLITKWFYGIQIPKTEQLVIIASKLNMSLQYLLTGTAALPEDKVKYSNSPDNDVAQLFLSYDSLTSKNKEILRKVCYGLVLNQKYSKNE